MESTEQVNLELLQKGPQVWQVVAEFDGVKLAIGQVRQDLVGQCVTLTNYHGFERHLFANVPSDKDPAEHVLMAAATAALSAFFEALASLDFVTDGEDGGEDGGASPITAPDFFTPSVGV